MYGLGLSALMHEWKRLFDPSQIFLPYSILTLMLTEVAVYNVFIYISLIAQFQGQSYFSYLTYLIPPFLFYTATNVFTPDKGDDTKAYFLKRMPLFFILLTLMIASHFIFQMEETKSASIVRLVIIGFLVLIVISKKIWLIYPLALLWLASFLIRGFIVSG